LHDLTERPHQRSSSPTACPTIRDADWVLVMKDGRIVEQGTHDQLLAADGFYASLYRSQFADASVLGAV